MMRWGVISLLLLLGTGIRAQQVAHFTQYMHNNMLLNPANIGVYERTDVAIGHRIQWVGFEGAPETSYASFNKLFVKEPRTSHKFGSIRISKPDQYEGLYSRNQNLHHALGGYFIREANGPTVANIGTLGYTLHSHIGQRLNLSFGGVLGFFNYQVDPFAISLSSDVDNTYANFIGNTPKVTKPTFDWGVRVYTREFHIGYAMIQSAPSRISFSGLITDSKLEAHHVFHAGGRYRFTKSFTLEPLVVVRYVAPLELLSSWDVVMKMVFSTDYYALLALSAPSQFIVGGGAVLKKGFRCGYSYTLGLGAMQQYQAGSHEIVLGMRFG